jgi:hypothetical protein
MNDWIVILFSNKFQYFFESLPKNRFTLEPEISESSNIRIIYQMDCIYDAFEKFSFHL